MTKQPIIVPLTVLPQKKDNGPCKNGPIYFNYKRGIVMWLKEIGDHVEQGDAVCEAEVEKKTALLTAPVSGMLTEICIDNAGEFGAGDILGYIDQE